MATMAGADVDGAKTVLGSLKVELQLVFTRVLKRKFDIVERAFEQESARLGNDVALRVLVVQKNAAHGSERSLLGGKHDADLSVADTSELLLLVTDELLAARVPGRKLDLDGLGGLNDTTADDLVEELLRGLVGLIEKNVEVELVANDGVIADGTDHEVGARFGDPRLKGETNVTLGRLVVGKRSLDEDLLVLLVHGRNFEVDAAGVGGDAHAAHFGGFKGNPRLVALLVTDLDALSGSRAVVGLLDEELQSCDTQKKF